MSELTSQRRTPLGMRTGVALAAAAVLAAACSGQSIHSAASPPVPSKPSMSPTSPAPRPSVTEVAVPKPHIVSKPIPFSDSRKRQMRAYVRRHYGLDTFRLVRPKVIVEHFTVIRTFEPVFNTFAANRPHLGEPPGTCAHFVVDTDGTIYQLVPLDLMCRHTVGLNYTSIGIEMVGESDKDILGNPPQLDAALDVTLWLMQQFHIHLRNVIGHNESLTSPLRKELVASLRCQTHQDWNHEDMEIFRMHLARLARSFHMPLGPPARPVNSGC